jgi:hypothetical protein
MAEAVKSSGPADYGLDAPIVVKRLFVRAGWLLAVGLELLYVNHAEYPGPSDRLFIVFGGIGMVCLLHALFMIWSSRVAKPKLRDRLIDSLALKGDEIGESYRH